MKTSRKISRVLTLMLAFALLLQGIVFADDLPFIDVSPDAWYYGDVKTAYETGLINGRSATVFAPDENMTYAEAVKLAACMHQLKNDGKVTLTTGEPWYITYVNYAKQKKLISGDLVWNDKATRAGYMQIFAQVLPDISDPLNNIADGSIPDVPMSHKNAAAIYKLYRYGIVQGVDALHNCNPGSNIKRSEVAAILTRMMNESKRISFSLGGESPTEKLKIAEQPKNKNMTKSPTEDLTFSVKISGGKAPYAYKWCYQYESEKIEEKSQKTSDKTNSITLNVSDKKGVFFIWCVITDESGQTVTSEKAKAIPKAADKLTITQQPKDGQMTAATQEFTFSVTIAGGKAPYSYGWEFFYGDGSVATTTGETDKKTISTSYVVSQSAIDQYG
ncbi:MAG TPA: S-layer homology domain-containing protein, partial [Clostridiales bacterium]|nr:S-layer homology domain-containing protein [Clostridiales bacterium]